MIRNEIINQLYTNGFNVKGRYIQKRSSRGGIKTVGLLNENNFYFFSGNVYPYKSGSNFFDSSTLVNPDDLAIYRKQVTTEKKAVNQFEVSFEKYIDATSSESIFTDYLKKVINEYTSEEVENYYDLRGVSVGYMRGAVAFPFIDIDNNFQTAQLIKYDAKGKRLKDKFSTNWLHSYKDLKEGLDLDKLKIYSKKITCFFGEQYLKGSSNPIAIVEAPKTAVILKEIYPNIDWIATAGEQALFNKNLEVLRGKDVILFPDAFTTKWKEFANSNGYSCSDILEQNGAEEGSDLADYIFNSDSEVFLPLHNLLFSINSGDFDFQYNEDKLEFNFVRVGNDKSYFTAVPTEAKGIIIYKDNSNEFKIVFKGKHFDFYSSKYLNDPAKPYHVNTLNKYEVLNAQIDWHKQDTKKEGKLVGFNEEGFKWHLQKCYRTLKHLNPNTDILPIFKEVLFRLNTESNFRFSEKYVLRRLIPIWNKVQIPISNFLKYRDWKYKGNVQLSRSKFETELNNDRFRKKLSIRLKALKDVLKEERFIFLESDLAIGSNEKLRGFKPLADLVKQWNEEVIGCSTANQYFQYVQFFRKIQSGSKSIPPHIESTYRVDVKMNHLIKSTLSEEYSLRELAELSEVPRNQVKRILEHRPNRDTATLIPNQVQNLIERIKDIEPIRMTYTNKNGEEKKRISNFKIIQSLRDVDAVSEHRLNLSEAFPNKEQLKRGTPFDIYEYNHLLQVEQYVQDIKRKTESDSVIVDNKMLWQSFWDAKQFPEVDIPEAPPEPQLRKVV